MEIWGRGGGKSTTVELGVTYVGHYVHAFGRRVCLYISGTQTQADKHVAAIGEQFLKLGVGRAMTEYGHSKGWKHNELRAATGFNVVALGLDSATRGIKLDQFRPDLIILDDVDGREDTPETTRKKIAAITNTILPAGSGLDCAVLFIQNLIHEDSIASMLVDGRADFLHRRRVGPVEVAVQGLAYEKRFDEDLQKFVFVITSGAATWEGQSLSGCEKQLNDWGVNAFLREAQQDVRSASGYFFDSASFGLVEVGAVPELKRVCRAWDLAATQGGGDFTCGVKLGASANGNEYVLDVCRGQWSGDNVRLALLRCAILDVSAHPSVRVSYHLPRDPAQAGADQALLMGRLLKGDVDWSSTDWSPYLVRLAPEIAAFRLVAAKHGWDGDQAFDSLDAVAMKAVLKKLRVVIEPVSGRKATRAEDWARKVCSGNVSLVSGSWNQAFVDEHRRFRADEKHEFDDQVDAASDAHTEICSVSGSTEALRQVEALARV